jgi:AcrR family transcriptional regulator
MFRQEHLGMKKRRVPTQERSKKRVESILDAAAVEFVQVGYDNSTVDAIAERAGTSVGSIYQFFPNKQALFEALSERCIQRTKEVFEEALTPKVMQKGWEAILGRMLEAYYEWECTDITARAIYRNLHLYGIIEAADRALNTELVERAGQLLAFYSDLPPARRRVVATTIVNAANSFLFYARQEKESFARKMLEETKTMLIRYLRDYAHA